MIDLQGSPSQTAGMADPDMNHVTSDKQITPTSTAGIRQLRGIGSVPSI
jgi:hypothetical protein